MDDSQRSVFRELTSELNPGQFSRRSGRVLS